MLAILSQPDDGSRAFAAHVASLAVRLGAAQRGEGPAVEVHEGAIAGEFTVTHPADAPGGVAVVVRTSGSTGTPKRTALPAASLAASAAATREHLGGDGHWLLALPLHYVAGLAVLSRALLGRTRVATLDLREHFTEDAFVSMTAVLRGAVGAGERLYTSLVPTQLTRLLAGSDASPGIAALREYAAILVGGGRTPAPTLERARALGLPVVLTYGSAETCGGCVYDGRALPGVSVGAVEGRLRLGGPMVAGPYLGDPERSAEHFVEDASTRWYVTDDLGTVSSDGTVSVSGRVDDVINTGGVKVSAQAVQAVLERALGPDVELLVVPVDSAEWGQRVGLVVAPLASAASPIDAALSAALEAALDAVRSELGAPAVPRAVRVLPALPRLSTGKPDRRTSAALLAEA